MQLSSGIRSAREEKEKERGGGRGEGGGGREKETEKWRNGSEIVMIRFVKHAAHCPACDVYKVFD